MQLQRFSIPARLISRLHSLVKLISYVNDLSLKLWHVEQGTKDPKVTDERMLGGKAWEERRGWDRLCECLLEATGQARSTTCSRMIVQL